MNPTPTVVLTTTLRHPDKTAPAESVLMEAERLVNGPRQEDYKHPRYDYDCTALMWQAMIEKRYGTRVPLTADFCCLMMAAMKISREVGKPKRDNRVDAAGYVLCADMCTDP